MKYIRITFYALAAAAISASWALIIANGWHIWKYGVSLFGA